MILEHNGESIHGNANDTIFKYITDIDPISYKERASIRRTVSTSTSAAHLEYDFPTDYTGDFEISLVARFTDSTFANLERRASFFNTAEETSNSTTFQLGVGTTNSKTLVDGNCNKNQYTIRYSGGQICGAVIADKVQVDEQFHTFNIKYTDATQVIDFSIDNVLVESQALGTQMIIEALTLFTNRGRDKASKAEIGELFLLSNHLSTEDDELLSDFLLCKYQD